MQAFKWTALFFAVNERRPEVLDYLLRSERVDVKHVDDVSPDHTFLQNATSHAILICYS